VQRNKAAAVARVCAALHTCDRPELLGPLARGAAEAGRVLDVFVQVSLDGDPERGGADVADVPALADAVAAETRLRLAGVMAVPPLGSDAAVAFARLQEISARLREDHPGASAISAGMSADLEIAVSHGATHLRVGTDLMGSRA
jgi:PLP dependent protein